LLLHSWIPAAYSAAAWQAPLNVQKVILMTVFVFPDTNVWIHCRPLDQVDWIPIFGDNDVRFIATDPLVRELDQLKYAARTRDRARRALSMIESWANADAPVSVRNGVTGQYWVPREVPNVGSKGLDPAHLDDVLIAYAHDFGVSNPGTRVVILTDDSGPRLTARRVGLGYLSPPESARDAGRSETPEETELRRLRAENEALKNRQPRILLRIRDGAGDGSRIEVDPPAEEFPSKQDYVARAVDEAGKLAPPIAPPVPQPVESRKPPRHGPTDLTDPAFDLSQVNSYNLSISEKEYERYTRERDEYLAKVTSRAELNWSILEENRRSVQLDILIANEGSAPAEDIDAMIHVPDGPGVEKELGRVSKPPGPPTKPRTFAESLQDMMRRDFTLRDLGLPLASGLNLARDKPNVSDPNIRRSNSYDVRVHVRRLKQHQSLRLARLVLVFPPALGVQSMSLDYKLNSATLPQPVTGTLHIVARV
jgi:hypothetical protein